MNPVYLPHAVCLSADPWLIRLLIVSNSMVALAYLLIPAAIFIILSEFSEWKSLQSLLIAKRELIGSLFMAFILSCGLTHVFSVVVLYHPVYWLEGFIILATGIISMVTAWILFWVAYRAPRA